MRSAWLPAAIAVIALGVAACGVIPAATSPAPIDPAVRDLHVENGTTLPISVVIDGEVATVVAPMDSLTIPSGTLPSRPYALDVRIPSGRVLEAVAVDPSSITQVKNPDGTGSGTGVGFRLGLSCGQLTVWIGVPLAGPYPGTGTSGDCDP